MCHSCTNLVHGTVPEVCYLHEVCHSCTNLVHGIVPEVCYLHEVCHLCTNLVHGIVPEVCYLHEVCQSCTILVHGIVPEVCYLHIHEVCHSCTSSMAEYSKNNGFGPFVTYCSTNWVHGRSQRSSAVYRDLPGVWENCISRTHLKCIIEHAHCSHPQMVRLRLV